MLLRLLIFFLEAVGESVAAAQSKSDLLDQHRVSACQMPACRACSVENLEALSAFNIADVSQALDASKADESANTNAIRRQLGMPVNSKVMLAQQSHVKRQLTQSGAVYQSP